MLTCKKKGGKMTETVNEKVKIYVGNLNYETSDTKLEEEFSEYGNVEEVAKIPTKPYAFVIMNDKEKAEAAIEKLDGKRLDGRQIIVELSDPGRKFDKKRRYNRRRNNHNRRRR